MVHAYGSYGSCIRFDSKNFGFVLVYCYSISMLSYPFFLVFVLEPVLRTSTTGATSSQQAYITITTIEGFLLSIFEL